MSGAACSSSSRLRNGVLERVLDRLSGAVCSSLFPLRNGVLERVFGRLSGAAWSSPRLRKGVLERVFGRLPGAGWSSSFPLRNGVLERVFGCLSADPWLSDRLRNGVYDRLLSPSAPLGRPRRPIEDVGDAGALSEALALLSGSGREFGSLVLASFFVLMKLFKPPPESLVALSTLDCRFSPLFCKGLAHFGIRESSNLPGRRLGFPDA